MVLRIFVVDDHDCVHPIPLARFQRFRAGEALLGVECGTQARMLELVLAVENRKPVRVIRRVAFLTPLGRDGYLDERADAEYTRGAIDGLGLGASDEHAERARFARKRFANEWTWAPCDAVLRQAEALAMAR